MTLPQFHGLPAWVRPHLAAVRAFAIATVTLGLAYPAVVTGVALLPGLHHKAEGSLVNANGHTVGSALIGQAFADADGNPLRGYFQPRPSAAGGGYDPTATSASNLGPESVVDTLPDPSAPAGSAEAAGKSSLLTQVCARSLAVAAFEGLPASDGARPYCTGGGVGAVLAVFGPRNAAGDVTTVARVVSLNEACPARPFVREWKGATVECGKPGEDYAAGLVVPVRGDAPADPVVPPDAVTASASGLDRDISPAYARLQAARIAKERGLDRNTVLTLIADHTTRRALGFMGEPAVDVFGLNRDLDRLHARSAPTPVPTPTSTAAP